MFGTFLLVPTLLELPAATGYGFGKSVSQAGLFLLPTVADDGGLRPAGRPAGPPLRAQGAAVPRHRPGRPARSSCPPSPTTQLWQMLVSGLLTGAGIGLAFAAMSNAIIESVPATQTGEATSVNAIARTIGSSIGTAVVAAVITSNSTAAGPAHRRGVHRRVLGLRRRRRPRRRRRRSPCPRRAAATSRPSPLGVDDLPPEPDRSCTCRTCTRTAHLAGDGAVAARGRGRSTSVAHGPGGVPKRPAG